MSVSACVRFSKDPYKQPKVEGWRHSEYIEQYVYPKKADDLEIALMAEGSLISDGPDEETYRVDDYAALRSHYVSVVCDHDDIFPDLPEGWDGADCEVTILY